MSATYKRFNPRSHAIPVSLELIARFNNEKSGLVDHIDQLMLDRKTYPNGIHKVVVVEDAGSPTGLSLTIRYDAQSITQVQVAEWGAVL